MFERRAKGDEQLARRRYQFRAADLFDSMEELHGSQHQQRYISKNGFPRITYENIPGMQEKAFKDIFHTIVDAKWGYFMILFTISFSISWLVFATAWYVLIRLKEPRICVEKVDNFVTAFLFSIETQVSIGYGVRSITTECPEGILLLIVQIIAATFINCALLGVLFTKLGHPKNRGKTVVFSKNAVIYLRNGQYCLMYKYVDLRERRLLDSNMRLVMVRSKLTKEGEYVPVDMADMTLTIDQEQIEFTYRLFPLYPLSLIHVIDETSPLYKVSKESLHQDNFEIISIVEGVVPGTGNITKALTSFKPGEIMWGHRFYPLYFDMGFHGNCIDLSTFDDTYKDDVTPVYSAEQHNNNINSKNSKEGTKMSRSDSKDSEFDGTSPMCSTSTVNDSRGSSASGICW